MSYCDFEGEHWADNVFRQCGQRNTQRWVLWCIANPRFKQYFFFFAKKNPFPSKKLCFLLRRVRWPCPGFKKLPKQFWTLFRRVRHVSGRVGHVSDTDTWSGRSLGASEMLMDHATVLQFQMLFLEVGTGSSKRGYWLQWRGAITLSSPRRRKKTPPVKSLVLGHNIRSLKYRSII